MTNEMSDELVADNSAEVSSQPEHVDLDEQCAAAVDLARSALLEEVQSDHVGDHLEVVAEAPLVATLLFRCTNVAYVGWNWAVTVTRAEGYDEVNVAEIVLLPGADSVLAPDWVPWDKRVGTGDLGVGDVLPTPANDPRLVQGFTGADQDTALDDDLHPILWELGLGRVRVMSQDGRLDVADRWHSGSTGPDSKMAKAADNQCSTCGFMLAMAGPMGTAFGVCGNEVAPSDGHVVALDFGCGGHSEVVLESNSEPDVPLAIDELNVQLDTEPFSEADETLLLKAEAEDKAAAIAAAEAIATAEAAEAEAKTAEEVKDAENPVDATTDSEGETDDSDSDESVSDESGSVDAEPEPTDPQNQ